MKLITFQTKEAWQALQKNGILKVDRANIDLQKYGVPYDWIVCQMKKRKIQPQNGEQYPLWAWASFSLFCSGSVKCWFNSKPWMLCSSLMIFLGH